MARPSFVLVSGHSPRKTPHATPRTPQSPLTLWSLASLWPSPHGSRMPLSSLLPAVLISDNCGRCGKCLLRYSTRLASSDSEGHTPEKTLNRASATDSDCPARTYFTLRLRPKRTSCGRAPASAHATRGARVSRAHDTPAADAASGARGAGCDGLLVRAQRLLLAHLAPCSDALPLAH